jgi:hypothetical protein
MRKLKMAAMAVLLLGTTGARAEPTATEIFDLKTKCLALGQKMLENDGNYQYERRMDEELLAALDEDMKAEKAGECATFCSRSA